jgi:hypothetical protein
MTDKIDRQCRFPSVIAAPLHRIGQSAENTYSVSEKPMIGLEIPELFSETPVSSLKISVSLIANLGISILPNDELYQR